MSLKESFIVFVCFGRVISQNLFRNLTFEIIDYFKCRSNGSSRPHLNQMLEFSLNRPTTNRSAIYPQGRTFKYSLGGRLGLNISSPLLCYLAFTNR